MPNQEHLSILNQGVEAWNRWREDSPNVRPDLSYSVLNGGEFQKAQFSLSNFYRAGLSRANLNAADFRSANLRGAKLDSADLSGVSLNDADASGANFRGANLNGVDLLGTNLSGADLNKADLTNSVVGWTRFADNDLSTVKGLDSVRHEGPSTIGIDTIYLSQGNIPEKFLRVAGIPDTFITFVSSLTAKPIEFYSCFISYSHAEKSFARCLHDALQRRGIRCWLDEHQIMVGDNLYREVDKGIRLWDKVLLCASKHSLTSWWVDRELDTAIEKEQQLRKERGKEILVLVPLNLDGFIFSPEWMNSHAATVRKRLAADFTGWETDNTKFEEQLDQLVKALRVDAGAKEIPPTPKL